MTVDSVHPVNPCEPHNRKGSHNETARCDGEEGVCVNLVNLFTTWVWVSGNTTVHTPGIHFRKRFTGFTSGQALPQSVGFSVNTGVHRGFTLSAASNARRLAPAAEAPPKYPGVGVCRFAPGGLGHVISLGAGLVTPLSPRPVGSTPTGATVSDRRLTTITTQHTPMQSPSSDVIDGNSTARDSPDYTSVEIPAESPEQFTYQERRADLLRQIRDLGHPSMIHQTEAAERYGVSQAQISKDLDRLAESVREHIVDRDQRAFTVDSVVRRAIQGLLEEGEYREAAQTAMEYDEWLTEFHDLRQLEKRVAELKQTPTNIRDIVE